MSHENENSVTLSNAKPMATILQFDPPGGLDDFDSIPHQRDAWSEFLSNTFDGNIQAVADKLGQRDQSQFYNPLVTDTVEPSAQKQIQWRGFPLLIEQKHPGNKKAAFKEADKPLPNGERRLMMIVQTPVDIAAANHR